MNQKQYLLLSGWSYAFAVIVLSLIFAFQRIDEFGIIFGIIFLAILSYKSYSCFRELKNMQEDEEILVHPTNSSTTEGVSFYKRTLFIGIPAFTILSIWTYFDLNNLESGTDKYVGLWKPVALLYSLGGYWLAVLATPSFGILIVFLLLRKIKELKKIKKN